MLKALHKFLGFIVILPFTWFVLTACLLQFADNIDRFVNSEILTSSVPTNTKIIAQQQAISKFSALYDTEQIDFVLMPQVPQDVIKIVSTHQTYYYFNAYTFRLLGKKHYHNTPKYIFKELHTLGFLNFKKDVPVILIVVSIILLQFILGLVIGVNRVIKGKFILSLTHLHKFTSIISAPLLIILPITVILNYYFDQPWLTQLHSGAVFGFVGKMLWLYISLVVWFIAFNLVILNIIKPKKNPIKHKIYQKNNKLEKQQKVSTTNNIPIINEMLLTSPRQRINTSIKRR